MNALRIILDEHQSLAAILHAIRFMIGEFDKGALQPDFSLLVAMIDYLEAYPEKRHHPKEDRFVFEILKKRTDQGDRALVILEAQHAESDGRIAELRQALEAYREDPGHGLVRFSDAFNQYADFYRGHMLLEETDIFPLVRLHFTEADWQQANDGFASDADPQREGCVAGSEEDFRKLFSQLVNSAPPPIGFGNGPFNPKGN